MKKLISLAVLFIAFVCAKGQEINFLGNNENVTSIYVGSLSKGGITNGFQKLKIEVYGGDYETSSLGTTIYSVGVRSGKSITVTRNNGAGNKVKLVVFENGDNYDFVIQNTQRWISLNIKATYLNTELNKIYPKQNIDIKLYDAVGKNDVTADFVQTVMTATDRNGNFGVGTLTPQAKLDVRGKIIADEVQIKVNTGADFVFDPNYKLKPLSEIESFVKENRHLQEIPSEKEMVENGLNVNEMQIKLLQKIEELTLYVIELDKKNKEQEAVVTELKEENRQIKLKLEL